MCGGGSIYKECSNFGYLKNWKNQISFGKNDVEQNWPNRTKTCQKPCSWMDGWVDEWMKVKAVLRIA